MSELRQTRRLLDAELTPGPELWARLEGRLAPKAVRPRRVWGWYGAAAACLLLMLAALPRLVNVSKVASFQPMAVRQSLLSTPQPARLAAATLSKEEKAGTTVVVQETVIEKRESHLAAHVSAHRTAFAKTTVRTTTVTKTSKMEGPAVLAAAPSADTQTVAEFNAPRFIPAPADSMQVLSEAIGVTDSLDIFLASASRYGRDSVRAKPKPNQKQTLINKLNKALRWLPGGSAWPTIRFEKAEVAVAYHSPPPEDPTN